MNSGARLEEDSDGENEEELYQGSDQMNSLEGLGSPLNNMMAAKKGKPIVTGPIAEIPAFRGGGGNGGEKRDNSQSRAPPDAKKVLSLVENFLLPRQDQTCPWRRGPSDNSAERANLRPEARLNDVLYQVALADHIRSFQTMYRDTHDELKLFSDLREQQQQPPPSKKIKFFLI